MQSEKIIQKFQFFKPIQPLNENKGQSNSYNWIDHLKFFIGVFMLFSFMLCLNFGVNKVVDYKYKDEISQQKVVINDINKELKDKGFISIHNETRRYAFFNITSDESKKEELVASLKEMIKDKKIEDVDMKYDFSENTFKAKFVIHKFKNIK